MVRRLAGVISLSVLSLSGCRHSDSSPPPYVADFEGKPSLAANMASMEVHLSRLFRALNGGRMDAAVRVSASELLRLQRESRGLYPSEWTGLPEQEKRALVASYRASAVAMADLLEALLVSIDKKDSHEAKAILERIDSFRRKCHVEFG